MSLRPYLPSYLFEIDDFADLIQAEEKELEQLDKVLDMLENNSIATYADEEGVERLEAIYAIIPSGTLQDRRERLKAKKRGLGATNQDGLSSVALAYECGEIEVLQDFENYLIKIKFTSVRGIPKNQASFELALKEFTPAHLGLAFIYSFLNWAEFDEYHLTWSAWDALNLTWEEFEIYRR